MSNKKPSIMISMKQAALIVQEEIENGTISQAQANVRMIQLEGVRVIRNRIPRQVRKELTAAVKKGELGHLKKSGLKPEVYFRRDAVGVAIEKRKHIEDAALESLQKIYTKKV